MRKENLKTSHLIYVYWIEVFFVKKGKDIDINYQLK